MNARDYALVELDRVRLPGWRAKLIHKNAEPPTDPRDVALAEQIRVGVIKNHLLLNYLAGHYTKHPGRIDPLVRKILSIGLYQLRFLTRVPASAVVDEAAEQAKRFGRRHAVGFVNAVLRRAAREPDVPLPDSAKEPHKYAEIVLSHPADLVSRIFELSGPENGLAFCKHNNTEPPTVVRLGEGIAQESLTIDDVKVVPHEQPGLVVVEKGRRLTFAQWAAHGLGQVQDATAADVVQHMDIHPGQDLLDRCAGMGTKTLQMRGRLGATGWIMAVDSSEDRCKELGRLLQTRGIENIAVVNASRLEDVQELRPPAFDRILLDVPCSNSGVLARRPEARYAQSPRALASLTELQKQILVDTAEYLRPGGLLVYSTCSVWPEENELRVRDFLDRHPNYEEIDARLTWPSLDDEPAHYHDGGFFSVLRRRS